MSAKPEPNKPTPSKNQTGATYPHDKWAIAVNQRLEARQARSQEREKEQKAMELERERIKLEKSRLDLEKLKVKQEHQREMAKLQGAKHIQQMEVNKSRLAIQETQLKKAKVTQSKRSSGTRKK